MYNQIEFFRSAYARQYGPLNPPNPEGTVSYEIYVLKLRKALAEWQETFMAVGEETE